MAERRKSEERRSAGTDAARGIIPERLGNGAEPMGRLHRRNGRTRHMLSAMDNWKRKGLVLGSGGCDRRNYDESRRDSGNNDDDMFATETAPRQVDRRAASSGKLGQNMHGNGNARDFSGS